MVVHYDDNNNEYEVIDNVLHIRKGSAGDGMIPNFMTPGSIRTSVVSGDFKSNVVIEEGITSIGDYAFLENFSSPALIAVTIPNSVTFIGDYAFSGCQYLASALVLNNVETIGDNAFRSNRALTDVTIGKEISQIGNSAFYGCTSLTSVTIKATSPPTLYGYAFDPSDPPTIYVPADSVNAYKSAPDWAEWAHLIQAMPGGYEKMTHSGNKIQVESAIRDGTGKKIDTHYQKKLTAGEGITIEGDTISATSLMTMLQAVYPVGSVYVNASNSANPGTIFGFGTWESLGAGRCLMGVDTSQTEFNTVGKTGGEKTHTLTTTEMPSHTHTQNAHSHGASSDSRLGDLWGQAAVDGGTGFFNKNSGTASGPFYKGDNKSYRCEGTSASASSLGYHNDMRHSHGITVNGQTATNQNTGGSGAHNNLAPYITVYMWKRTA